MLKDAFYTPTYLGEKLISFIPKKKYKHIVDFCVGDGELLRVAQERWKNANFYGTDISAKTIKNVKQAHAGWILGVCDFLNYYSRKSSYPLKKANSEFDLILLNPPFSCIGATVYSCVLDDISFTCSRAMAFIVEAVKYINATGSLFAILPNSVMYSQKDEKILSHLVKHYRLKLLEESGARHFDNCSPHVVLISIKAPLRSQKTNEYKILSHTIKNISLSRGIVQMHSIAASRKGNYLIHTTNLNDGKVEGIKAKHKSHVSQINGPAILLPRVGNPNLGKICILKDPRTFIISDCIIAIKTSNKKNLLKLHSLIIADWNNFKKLYKGTGAKYTTLKRLKRYLNI